MRASGVTPLVLILIQSSGPTASLFENIFQLPCKDFSIHSMPSCLSLTDDYKYEREYKIKTTAPWWNWEAHVELTSTSQVNIKLNLSHS